MKVNIEVDKEIKWVDVYVGFRCISRFKLEELTEEGIDDFVNEITDLFDCLGVEIDNREEI